ncbi:glycosyltransferase family 2 protein [Rariglobus hedericola]|nr:glycosyltransferase family 2 protein [Rariglobus hedericola]
MRIELSVVMPCYNEAEGLAQAIRRVHAVCKGLFLTHEILIIDDGSTDGSWAIVEDAAQSIPEVRGLRFSRNFGHEAASSAGLRHARGIQVLILDADLQDPPELLAELRAKMAEGYDVVYGVRRSRAGESWLKLVSAKLFYRVFNLLTDNPIPEDTGDFRLMTRRAVDAFVAMPESVVFLRGMISWIGFPQVGIYYDRKPRETGRSKYNFRKLLGLCIEAITGFSVRPLRIAFVMSMALFLGALGLTAVILIGWLSGRGSSDIALVMMVISFIGGVQTLVMGVIGEYLGKLFVESKGRPLYLIRDTIDKAALDAESR